MTRVNAPAPSRLVRPVPLDPDGRAGPTRGQASGPLWRRSSPGLFVPRDVDRSVVEQRILEESGRLPTTGAVAGWAALRLHGVGFLDGLGPDGRTLRPVPLLVPAGTPLRSAPGIEAHRERLDPTDLVLRQGIRTTDADRSAFDAARWSRDLREAVCVLDLALASRTITRPGFDAYVETRTGWSGVRLVLRALDLTDPRTMSPMESALRLIWRLDAGLAAPRCNWPVADADGNPIGRPDLLSTHHAVVGEFDGAAHRSRSQHREDLRRDDRFRAVGLEPFRVVGADLADVPLVVTRIRAALERSRRSQVPRTWLIAARPGQV